VLDLNRKQATLDEQPLALTAYEYRILEYLMRHHQQVVAKDRLMEQLYPDDDERDRTSSKCWSAACAASLRASTGSNRSTPCAAWATCSMSAADDSFSARSLDAGRRRAGGVVHAGVAAGHAEGVQPGAAGFDRAAPGLGRDHADFRGAGRAWPLQMPAQLPDERFNLPYTACSAISSTAKATGLASRATAEGTSITSRATTGAATSSPGFTEPMARSSSSMTSSQAAGRQERGVQHRRPAAGARIQGHPQGLREKLYLGFGAVALLDGAAVGWPDLGLRSLRRLSHELDEVEAARATA
jgi:hypothetical protein